MVNELKHRLAEAITLGAKVQDSVGDSIWTAFLDSVRTSVGTSVDDSVEASAEDLVEASVEDSIEFYLGALVWTFVRASVRNSLWDFV